jgi:alpha-beta hydrolase superfamily lysophospholipase
MRRTTAREGSAELRAGGIVRLAAGTLLAAGLLMTACGAAPDGPGGPPSGLRFEALPPIDPAQVAPIETWPARDGSRLPVRHYPADAGVTLVLVHGSGHHGRYLAPLAQRLAAVRAARVYTPDLRGHGMAPARRGDIDYTDQLEDDLADLAALLRERHPGTRLVIGGHSSGGGLAVRYAGSRYQREGTQPADGFVLLAPYLGHDAPTTRPDAGWARPRVPLIVALSILNGFGITAVDGLTTLTFEMPEAVRDGTETLAYSHRLATGFAPRDYRRDLEGLRVPVLALIGAEDEAFFPERLAPALAIGIPARVEVIPGVAHLDLPASPAAAGLIAAWLAAP